MQEGQNTPTSDNQPKPASSPAPAQPALPTPMPLAVTNPPKEMPKPIAQVELGPNDLGGGETLDQKQLTEMLKKADQIRPAAPLDHPPIDITAPKPGNVITPGAKPQLPTLPAGGLKPIMPAAQLPKIQPLPAAALATPSKAPSISTFMAPDIRQLNKPAPPTATDLPPPPDLPKPSFMEPSPAGPKPETKTAKQPQTPKTSAKPKAERSQPFRSLAKSMLFAVEDGLSAISHIRLGARLRSASAAGILGGFLVLVLVLFIVPASRYGLGGLFIKKDYSIKVIDSATGDPVSLGQVSSNGVAATTDANGVAVLKGLRPGKHTFTVSKSYYASQQIAKTVPLFGGKAAVSTLSAIGNLVELNITNTITSQPLSGATVTAGNVKALSSSSGKALIAVAPGSGLQPADISLGGYNSVHAILSVVEAGVSNINQNLTPSGRVYYLSRGKGGTNLDSSLLDGTSTKTLLKASGQEGSEAELLPSPDNSFLALRARRTADPHAELYVSSVDGKDTNEIAFGQAQFSLYGWLGDTLIYSATYDNLKPWQAGTTVLSSYNAQTRKTSTIFTSSALGSSAAWAHQSLSYVMLVGGSVIYGAEWAASPNAPASLTASKSNSLNIALGDGSNQQVIASVNADTYGLEYKQNSPTSVYIKRTALGGGADHYFSYRFGDTQSTPALINATQFNQDYPNYYFSPDDKLTFWSQTTGSGNNLLIGNNAGQQPVKILEGTSYRPQGWYSANYLLVSNQSGLYIMGIGGGTPHKISGSYVSH